MSLWGAIDGAGYTLHDSNVCFELPMTGISMSSVSELSLMYFNSTFIWVQSWTPLVLSQFYSVVSFITFHKLHLSSGAYTQSV
jgi:hypothetical protein